MFRCFLFWVGLALVIVGSSVASELKEIRYTLRFSESAAHYVDVEAEFPTEGRAELIVFMPVWTPGSYLVREYARNIISFDASAPDGAALTSEKVAKNRWKIATNGQHSVRVKYRLYAREINVRGNWVESDHAMLNGAPTFVTVLENYQRRYEVNVEVPAGWTGSYTPLTPTSEPNRYTAVDFDTLVDSPILVGSPQVDRFKVDGVEHALVTLNGGEAWDNERVARSLQRIMEEQVKFWGGLPYREPYYVFNLLTGSRGGLEHRQSFVMSADRWLSRTNGGITSWMSLASHEFFHVWNGKRLRPVEYGPFEYEHETHSPSLWIVEGITSYYQHVLLARAGFYTRDQYLGAVSGGIAGVERTPGRRVQSLRDASFDTWIKSYRPDENSVNALFSYYGGGAIAGLLLDAEVQRVSAGKVSLDDVMRAAYARFSQERGYTEAEFIALVSEIAGQDMTPWFSKVMHRPGTFDYQPLLDWYGLEFETTQPTAVEVKSWQTADARKGWLGADTTVKDGRLMIATVRSDTPAATAGLSVDDEILAVEDYRVRPDELVRRLELYPPGSTVRLLIVRQDRVITLPATLSEEPKETWKLKIRPDATPEQTKRVQRWLGLAP
jgi:predicted metalloprotease with PDZ domain